MPLLFFGGYKRGHRSEPAESGPVGQREAGRMTGWLFRSLASSQITSAEGGFGKTK